MPRTLVSSPGLTANPWGGRLLSVSDVSKRLKISRQTVYKWMGPFGEDKRPLLATTGGQMIGSTYFRWFDPEYIKEIEAALPRGWGNGDIRVKADLAEELKAITAKWQKRTKK